MSHICGALLLFVLPTGLFAQAAVEAAMGASRAAAAAAPAAKAGKAAGGVFDKLNKSLERTTGSTSAKPAASSTSASPRRAKASVTEIKTPTAAPTPKPAVVYEDPSGIREGMDSAEVARRFGPPALQLTAGPDQETLCYTQGGTTFDVTMRAGKVTAIRRNGDANPAAVTIR